MFVDIKTNENPDNLVVFGEFQEEKVAPTIRVGDVVSLHEMETTKQRSREEPGKVWYRGMQYKYGDNKRDLTFAFNCNRKGWNYGWVSNKHTCDEKHVLRVFTFIQEGPNIRCVSTCSSPSFTVFCRRRQRARVVDLPPQFASEMHLQLRKDEKASNKTKKMKPTVKKSVEPVAVVQDAPDATVSMLWRVMAALAQVKGKSNTTSPSKPPAVIRSHSLDMGGASLVGADEIDEFSTNIMDLLDTVFEQDIDFFLADDQQQVVLRDLDTKNEIMLSLANHLISETQFSSAVSKMFRLRQGKVQLCTYNYIHINHTRPLTNKPTSSPRGKGEVKVLWYTQEATRHLFGGLQPGSEGIGRVTTTYRL